MATSDIFGQGVSIAALTDAPDAAVLAQNIVNAIAQRSIMRFASAATRAAQLTGTAVPVEGMMSWLQDVDELDVYQSGAWVPVPFGSNAWTNYTPTWSGLTNLGSSTSRGRYRQVGKTIDVIGCLDWGTSSSLGTGNITATLPVAASSVPLGSSGWQGSGRYNDGVNAWRGLVPFLAPGATTVTLQTMRTTDNGFTTPGNIPLTWATGASMRWQLTYETV